MMVIIRKLIHINKIAFFRERKGINSLRLIKKEIIFLIL